MSDSIEDVKTESENQEKPEVQAEEQLTEQPAEQTEAQPEAQGENQTEAEGNAAEKSEEEVQNEAEAKAEAPVEVPLAPRCENPLIGRKVFFVNPPLYVENYLHLELKQHEYEVYIISDYKYTKNALRQFPDALCFIFIDDEMTYDQWFNFIKSFQKHEKLKTIFVGLMSAVIPKPVKEKFMMNLSLPGGFIMLDEFKGSALIEKIVAILELNGAKGRRKYLRLDCDENVKINGYFATKSQLLQVTISSISSVGFTCYYPRSYGDALAKNMVVPSFSITLGRRSIVTPSVIYDVKMVDANRCFAVMLFLKQVGSDDRKVIKNFIFEQLEARFENLIYALPPDVEDYSDRGVKALEAIENPAAAEVSEAEGAATEGTETEKESEEAKETVETAEEVDSVETAEAAESVESK